MFPYYLLIGLPLLLSIFSYKVNDKRVSERFPLFVFFLILLVLLSLRSIECGADLQTYKNKFESINISSVKSVLNFSSIEFGYNFFVAINKLIFNNFQFLLFSCAVLSIVPIMVFYLRETKHNILTIALFVSIAPFSMFFSGLRQSIAMGIGIISYNYCKKNKIIIFLFMVFLAFLFHQSSIILLLMYPLTHVKITRKWVFPIIVLYILCFVYNKQIFEILLGLNEKYETRYVISETGSYTFLIMLLAITIFSLIIMKEDSNELLGLRNLLILSLFIQSFVPVNTVAMRLNYYYLLFIPVLIPNVIDNCKERYKQVAQLSTVVFSVFFIFWFFKEAYTGVDYLSTFPYVAFWESTI